MTIQKKLLVVSATAGLAFLVGKSYESYHERSVVQSSVSKTLDHKSFKQGRSSGVLGENTSEQSTYQKTVGHISIIQNISVSHPDLMREIREESWWKGREKSPADLEKFVAGNWDALLEREEIAKKYPEFYAKVSKHPLWELGNASGEEYVILDQIGILQTVSRRLSQFDEDTHLQEALALYGYSREDIFTADWSSNEGLYGIFDSLREFLDAFGSSSEDARSIFLASNLGKLYQSGKGDIEEMLEYLRKLRLG